MISQWPPNERNAVSLVLLILSRLDLSTLASVMGCKVPGMKEECIGLSQRDLQVFRKDGADVVKARPWLHCMTTSIRRTSVLETLEIKK